MSEPLIEPTQAAVLLLQTEDGIALHERVGADLVRSETPEWMSLYRLVAPYGVTTLNCLRCGLLSPADPQAHAEEHAADSLL